MFIKTILVRVSLLLSLISASPIELCNLSRNWGDKAYENKNNCQTTDLNLTASSFTVGGFSSGAIFSTNLFAMFADSIDGIAINSGFGPCANARYSCPDDELITYPTDGIKGKPVYHYHGTADPLIKNPETAITATWFEDRNANVKRNWISDFVHILPNSVHSNRQYNPPYSCSA